MIHPRPYCLAFWSFPLIYLTLVSISATALASDVAGVDAAKNRAEVTTATDYIVVVSEETLAQADWRLVVDTLVERHDAAIVPYGGSVADSLTELEEQFPRFACFVARPEEVSREFVAAVHQLTRSFDDDPYTDCFWGILTGFDAENALAIAQTDEPLVVRRAAASTEITLSMCEEGIWYSELEQHHMVRRTAGQEPVEERGPADTTQALVRALNDYQPDLFVTSSHASSRDWHPGYGYTNGTFHSEKGQLFGVDLEGQRHNVESQNPKVYMAVGNCDMGWIDGEDAMALTWLKSAGVRQMIAYVVPTWFGYGGWGCLDYFVEQPGRYTLTEAFFANHHALIHRMQTTTVGRQGLSHDRDTVVFYGDPAWEARMAEAPCAWDQTLTEQDGIYTLVILPRRGDDTFEPINTNGSQRGGRPIVAFLPHRIENVEFIEHGDLAPVVTDDFVLIPNPGSFDEDRVYRIVFRATPIE